MSTSMMTLIYQLIEDSHLVELIQALDGEELLQVIEHIGVEDAGDIISLTSVEQLTKIFDNVFWKSACPGEREKFDSQQFALWLEVAMEHSAGTANKMVNDMDDDLLVLGLAENLLVIDHESFLLRMQNSARSFEDDLLDKLLDSERLMEWGEMFIIPKCGGSWNTLIALLLDLDSEDRERTKRILESINHISTEYIEDNGGLYNVLTSGEMLENDLAAERETRREQQGYVSHESAAAFLKQAQVTSVEELLSSTRYDYLTKCYFAAFSPDGNLQKTSTVSGEKFIKALSDSFPAIYRQLIDAGIINLMQPKQFPVKFENLTSQVDIVSALQSIEKDDTRIFNKCLYELRYLANVLMAGDNSDGKKLTPNEAAEKTMKICKYGMHYVLGPVVASNPESVKKRILQDGLVKVFRIGWKVTTKS